MHWWIDELISWLVCLLICLSLWWSVGSLMGRSTGWFITDFYSLVDRSTVYFMYWFIDGFVGWSIDVIDFIGWLLLCKFSHAYSIHWRISLSIYMCVYICIPKVTPHRDIRQSSQRKQTRDEDARCGREEKEKQTTSWPTHQRINQSSQRQTNQQTKQLINSSIYCIKINWSIHQCINPTNMNSKMEQINYGFESAVPPRMH